MAWACFFIVVTFITVRFNFLIPDLAIYKLDGLEYTFFHPRLRTNYIPSLMEWLVSLWVISLGLIAFLAGSRWLPIHSSATEGENRGRLPGATSSIPLVPIPKKEEKNMPKQQKQTNPEKGMDRREFLKCTALLGGSLAASSYFLRFLDEESGSQAFADDLMGKDYALHLPENQIYSVCQQCNTGCGMKVKIRNGLVAKIDGNPYSPFTMTPHIPFETPLTESATIDGTLCPKGQAGIQTLYDPYRIIKVVKRAGKRGENKWKTIPFEQAIKEIVEGGDLFGEGVVTGLKDILVLKDKEIAAELGEDSAESWSKKDDSGGIQGKT